MAKKKKKKKQNFLSSLKKRVKDNQIMFINASITILLIGIVIFVLLFRSSYLLRDEAEINVVNLTGITANEVQSYYLAYSEITRSISQIMRNFEAIEITRRREVFSDTMREYLVSNNALVSIYSLWMANELDGMDAFYAGTEGTDETGQFLTGYTREKGWVERRAFPEYRYFLIMSSNRPSGDFPFATISDPMSRKLNYGDAWVFDVRFPIFRGNRLLGIIGATINLEHLQELIEQKRPYGTGRTLVCTNNGTVIAHNNAGLRGITFRAPDSRDPLFSAKIFNTIFRKIQESTESLEPEVLKTKDSLIVCYPLGKTTPLIDLDSGSGIAPWTVITEVPHATILAPLNGLIRFSVFFIVGAGFLAAAILFITSSSLTQQTRALQHSLQQASTLQDNLKYGLFLMDQNYVIQGAYSKAMERIMSVSDLRGKNFIDLLSNSVKTPQKQLIQDFFEMVFKQSFDKEMLDSINPINDFTYYSMETGEEKNIRTNFTLVEQGRSAYVLGTVEDITAEKELKKQLQEAESQRENEMRSLFQVIQLDPKVLSDFVADAEDEFDSLNRLFKAKGKYRSDVLVDMYQSIHAIKSNALILNLENFSAMLHKLENSIKNLQQKCGEEVPVEDFLGLVLELNEAMKEKDQLKAAISKIENFRNMSGEDKRQERYVLVETLTQVCKKAQTALNKKVRLVVEAIDDVVLDYGPRRAIKEVLTQLVRNAVYHGIEVPQEREPLGKDPEGEIRLSIKYRDNQIYIKFTDNGSGIDLGRVRQTAEAHNLFRSQAEKSDTNYLIKTIFTPGFTTLSEADFHAGRGIGLSLVKDRIKDLRGNIKVSTIQGRGTTFTIAIPMDIPQGVSV